MDTNVANPKPAICPRCGGPVSRRSPMGLCRRCIVRITLPQSKESPPVDSGLHVRCPQCGHAIELGEETGLSDIHCDSCGTRFSIVDDTTTNQVVAALDRIGQFEIREKLGTGAFGTVWKARDTRLDRWVAIKIPRQRQLEGFEAEKFLREARAAAHLQHPNIVRVFEVGRDGDLVYIVCDFVEGVSLAEWLTGRRISPRDAARLCRKIASALEHAHEHGVIHRDIKPGNILLDAKGEPHLTDFGLARREAGEVTMTLEGQLLGTPAYMSPEQARGEAHQSDQRTDMYSLGAVLFQLLTGELPFRGSTRMLIQQVIHDEPPSPRKLNSHVPRDLETICLKCLEKEPGRRFDSAGALGAELDRFLNGEPIHARPIGVVDKTWRWCRRKPALAAMAASVLALLFTVTAVSVSAAWRIASARKGEQREAYYSNIALASKLIEEGSIDRALETLWKCPEQYRHWEWGHLLYLCHQEAASFQAHSTNVWATSFSPDSRWVLSHDAAGTAAVWDWAAEQQVFAFGSSSNRVGWISFDPQGKHLAASMGTNGVSVWATTNWQEIVSLRPPGGEVTTLAYSPEGEQLVTGGVDGTVTLWDATSGQRVKELTTTHQPLRRVAISPDGQRLVAVAEHTAWVWELQSGQLVRAFPGDSIHSTNGLAVVFADDTGEHFATIDSKDRLTLWRDGAAPQDLITVRGRIPGPLRRVFFSPDGRWMANAGDQNTARVWEVASGTEYLAVGERVVGFAFSRDGTRMITRHNAYWVTTWDLTRGRRLKDLRGYSTYPSAAGLSPDGRLAVSGEGSGIIKVWSAGPGRELAQDRAWQWICTYSPDGRLMANCPWHEGVIIRSVRSGRELSRIHPLNESFSDIAFSPDGRRLATVGSQKTAKVWDVETGELVLRLRGHHRQTAFGVAYSPDGRRIAAGSLDGTAKIWSADTGRELLTLAMDPEQGYVKSGLSNRVVWVRFDAKSERLITGSHDGMVRIWDVATGKPLTTLPAGENGFSAIARLLPDQRRLITSAGNRIRIWDTQTGELITEAQGRGYIMGLSITSDGRRIIAAFSKGDNEDDFGDGALEIWDIEGTPRRLLTLNGSTLFNWAEFSPDNLSAAACSFDYRVYRWETFPWREAEYAEVGGEITSDGGQRSEVRDQRGQSDFADRVRAYARRYWRDRLQAELNGMEGETTEPRLIEVPIDRSLFPKRDPRAAAGQIDLTVSYTGELDETFHGKVGGVLDHDDDLSELPVGLVNLGGVEFDIRGVIQLRRTEPLGEAWEMAARDDPVRVDGIPIQQEIARLHSLLGTIQSEANGTVIGNLILHYADGETRSLDLVYGRDVREWWYEPARGDTEATDRAEVVWRGMNPVAQEAGRRLRLYLHTRENPRPGVQITTFDFVSAMSQSAPFLIGVTVE